MATLTVDLEAVAANWRRLSTRHGGKTAAVVKANGYGLGATAVATRLYAEGVREFFVAYPAEGAVLRPLLRGAMIGILGGALLADPDFYTEHDLAPVLGSLAELEVWQGHARRLGRELAALLHVDTGMNRLGLTEAELDRLAGDLGLLDGIALRYVMTHLTNAELPDDPGNAAQAEKFAAACARLPPLPRSLANSSGIFLGPAFRSDLARPGAAIYGINPVPGQVNPMQPVMRLTAPVLQLREIPAGDVVGYNGIWTAQRPTRVATVSLGYADGYHRCLSNHAAAFFDGGRLPLIGRVSMDLTTFDATDTPSLALGSTLELIGPAIPPDEVAHWAGTNGYEILTSLGSRLTRQYAPL